MQSWHYRESCGIHNFLTFAQGRWPPARATANARDKAAEFIAAEYERHLREQRALSPGTIAGHLEEARRFLDWLPGWDLCATLAGLRIGEVDRFLKSRATGVARTTARAVCNRMRTFLRFLHSTGRVRCDLATAIIAPALYRFEGIPSTISPQQIDTILATARKDRSDRGLRNYAMLLLLTTYGLRAGEVRRLQLQDIDWRAERFWIQASKTGRRVCLPLLPNVGRAILDYLQKARPPCKHREVFIRLKAPLRPIETTSALNGAMQRHLARIGIILNGKRGPHALRHARAASLLRAGVPLKTIGDLLGHRAMSSTAVYLKLADKELRSVALAIPVPQVSP